MRDIIRPQKLGRWQHRLERDVCATLSQRDGLALIASHRALSRECQDLRERVATLETTLRRTLRCPSETASNPNRRCGDPGGCQGEPCEKCRLLPASEEGLREALGRPAKEEA